MAVQTHLLLPFVTSTKKHLPKQRDATCKTSLDALKGVPAAETPEDKAEEAKEAAEDAKEEAK